MNVALLGFGVVGRGVYDLLAPRDDLQVRYVVCRRDVTLPDAKVTKDFREVLEDETVDTVVEAIGGLHPAFEYVRDAILAGKNIVTSNKALVATFYDELLPLVKEKGVSFRCTSAVGGGIGWLSELERARRIQDIHKVGGIMNGTCNYILDNMTRLGLGYDEALKQAQALGYAEADPSTDVEGTDTWHKAILSAHIAFGISLDTSGIPAAGIDKIAACDVEAFTAHGRVCKLLSTGLSNEGKISVFVQPTLVKQGEPESAVPLNFNLITFEGAASGRMSLYGQGAGRYPTAYNVVQDLVDILAGKSFYAPYGGKTTVCNDLEMSYYVRGAQWPGETVDTWGQGVITAPVSVSAIHAWRKENPDAFIAALA